MKFEVLQKDMIAAMKAHDKPRKDAIATLVADVKKQPSTPARVMISRKN